MRIIIFGLGKVYENNKKCLLNNEKVEIVCLMDNKYPQKTKDGICVIRPEQISEVNYDIVVIMSTYINEMRKQLLDLGCHNEKIWTLNRLICNLNQGQIQLIVGKSSNAIKYKKRILVISTDLSYDGGSMAAIYAVKALQNNGYFATLAARSIDSRLSDELKNDGINIVLMKALPYIDIEECLMIKQFDCVIVNVFQMIYTACYVSKIVPTMWWIHEQNEIYAMCIPEYSDYMKMELIEKLRIYAVSSIPQNIFNCYFPNRINDILNYGIPDMSKNFILEKEKGNCITFAIIGNVEYIKGQEIFLNALSNITEKQKNKCRFLIIGYIGNDAYGEKISKMAENLECVDLLGRLSRNEINDIFKEIDVVVSASLKDSLPIVMTEGMMYGKICIASDATGTADFIEDGVNGLICKAGDVDNLAFKMQWVIDNPDKLDEMRRNARKTYEENFTMEKFGQRLEEAINETIEMYGE